MVSNSEVISYFETPKAPLPLNFIAKGVLGVKTIIAAINPRSTEEVIRGILRAAKKNQSVVIFELALSEMSLSGGYTGYTPQKFADRCKSAASKEGWFAYALHADHLTVKKGTEEEISNVKREIEARVKSGFTGFAIDTSFLFNTEAKEVVGHLQNIISKGIILFNFLKEQMGQKEYGLEGEVGEIGIAEFTSVEEALHYVKSLAENDIYIDFLAIANGSTHGISVNAKGEVVPQLGINIQRTVEIADELKHQGFSTRIAQHGTTGTPIDIIASTFPHGSITKGNVGTYWQLLVYDILKEYEPKLYVKMRKWVLETYGKPDVEEETTFSKSSKYAWKEFFDDVENVSVQTKNAIIDKAENDMHEFIKAFKMENTAVNCFTYMFNNNLFDKY